MASLLSVLAIVCTVFGVLPLRSIWSAMFWILMICSSRWWVSLCRGWVLLEIPATVGVVGVVLVPWLAALGVIAALVTNCRVVVERRE